MSLWRNSVARDSRSGLLPLIPEKYTTPAGSTGRCNTTWYKSVSKGGVHDAETMEAVLGPAGRYVEPLEGGRVVACDWPGAAQGTSRHPFPVGAPRRITSLKNKTPATRAL
jgi:hypothetical protein